MQINLTNKELGTLLAALTSDMQSFRKALLSEQDEVNRNNFLMEIKKIEKLIKKIVDQC